MFTTGGADKISFLSDHASLNNSPFIAVTESWLRPDILEAEVEQKIPGFRILRSDRISRSHGGVAAYIREDLPGDTVDSFDNSVCEVLIIKLHTLNHYIAICYRPPGTTKLKEFKDAIDWLDSKLRDIPDPTATISLCGDFNFNKSVITWAKDADEDLIPTISNYRNTDDNEGLQTAKQAQILLDFTAKYFMIQYVDKPTRPVNNEILDLFFSNDSTLIASVSSSHFKDFSDHNLVALGLGYQLKGSLTTEIRSPDESNPTQAQRFQSLNFSKAPWSIIDFSLSKVDWSPMEDMDPNASLAWMLEKILDIVEECVPLKVPQKRKQNIPPERRKLWSRHSKLTKKLVNEKSAIKLAAIIKEKNLIEEQLTNDFKTRGEVEEKRACENISLNPKFFFSFAKKRQRTKGSVGPFIDPSTGAINPNLSFTAETMNTQYKSVFSVPKPEKIVKDAPLFYSSSSSPTILDNIDFNKEDIESACKDLSPRSAAGNDGVPAALLKSCRSSVSLPLFLLWKNSFDSGVIPEILIHAIISPLHKGGSRTIPKNFRPVALTSHIIKVFERVIRKFLVRYLEENNYMAEGQHGFRALRSTLTQLLTHLDAVLGDLESGASCDTIYLDFSKAFDKVDHGILHHKLRDLGIQGKTGVWLHSFLHNRKQTVVVEGHHSSSTTVVSGVPQGTVLGPALFLVLIMDISKGISNSTRVTSFADDTRASRPIRSNSDTNKLQEDLELIYKWADQVNMEFNSDKFECLRCWPHPEKPDSGAQHNYHVSNGEAIKAETEVKDLGVLFSPDLSFKPHILNMLKQTNKLIGWVLRTFRTRSRKLMLTVWRSLIQPKLDYCSQLWSPQDASTIGLLEDTQRHFTARIHGMRDKDYWDRLAELGLYSQQRRRERYACIFVWKCSVGLVSGYTLAFTNNPRRGKICTVNPISKSAPATVRRAKEASLAVHGARLFNILPRHVRDTVLPENKLALLFKKNLDVYLSKIPDQPTIQGRRRPANSNSLLDQIPMTIRSL